MSRTLVQKMADAHEAWIRDQIAGRTPKGSGNQWHDQLDAKNGTRNTPFPIGADGKATLGKSLSITRDLWAKLREQCFGEIPTWWGRFYRDENLHIVDLDLVALEAEDFTRILEAARKWAAIEEEVGHEGDLEVDYVIEVMRYGRDRQNEDLVGAGPVTVIRPDFRHQVRLLTGDIEGVHPVTLQEPCDSGCDCCR